MQNYSYDLSDQLVKAEIHRKDPETQSWHKEVWHYEYDALGRRVAKWREGETEAGCLKQENRTEFIWDGSHLLQEVYANGRYTYLYADQDSYEPLAQIHNWTDKEYASHQSISYFHCDQIGIPREMTDKDGKLLWFGDYAGWGKLKSETDITNAHQPFRLQNQYADRETGLHYNFFRYYEPNCGRFVNQDPIKLAGGDNLYGFGANAQRFIDPLGLWVWLLAGVGGGGAAATTTGGVAISGAAVTKGAVFVGSAAAVGYAGSEAMNRAQSRPVATDIACKAGKCTTNNQCPPCNPPAGVLFNKKTHHTHDHGDCLGKTGSMTHWHYSVNNQKPFPDCTCHTAKHKFGGCGEAP